VSGFPATLLALFLLAYFLPAFSRPTTMQTISTPNTNQHSGNKHMLKKVRWREKGTTIKSTQEKKLLTSEKHVFALGLNYF